MDLDAFITMKSKAVKPPALALSRQQRSYMIDTDSPAQALGAVLQQQNKINSIECAAVDY